MLLNMNMPTRDFVRPFAFVESKLSSDECDEILKIGKSKKFEKAENIQKDGTSAVTDVRLCNVTGISRLDSPETYIKMEALTALINEDMYRFDLLGFVEDLQFIEYEAPNGHYEKHIDKGLMSMTRKLTVVVLLSDENDYEGGELELYFNNIPIVAPRTRGTIITFPSYTLHRVTPVTKGTRYSLVGWVTGPNFR